MLEYDVHCHLTESTKPQGMNQNLGMNKKASARSDHNPDFSRTCQMKHFRRVCEE